MVWIPRSRIPRPAPPPSVDGHEACDAEIQRLLDVLETAQQQRDQARARVAELEADDGIVFHRRLREPTEGDCGHLLTGKLCGPCRRVAELEQALALLVNFASNRVVCHCDACERGEASSQCGLWQRLAKANLALAGGVG